MKAEMLAGLQLDQAEEADRIEKELGYFFEDGMYWKHLDKLDEKFLADIDRLWMAAVEASQPKLPISPTRGEIGASSA
ncbi:hypothetical protein [Mesorhizobium sp. M1399]